MLAERRHRRVRKSAGEAVKVRKEEETLKYTQYLKCL
jgi:hypothetical protein